MKGGSESVCGVKDDVTPTWVELVKSVVGSPAVVVTPLPSVTLVVIIVATVTVESRNAEVCVCDVERSLSV